MRVDNYTIGVDLGGSKIAVGVVNYTGKILKHTRCSVSLDKSYPIIRDQICTLINEMIEDYPIPLGIGLGVAGQIERDSGVINFAPNLNWHNVPLQNDLIKKFNIPCYILNDVRAATYGEWLHGAGQNCKDLICLFIGTGIGGGVVSNCHLLTGFSNSLGELGHITVDMHGPLCTCGNYGCLEAYAGGWAIAKFANDLAGKDSFLRKLSIEQTRDVDAKMVIDGYHQGDPLSMALINQAKEALVAGSVSLINAFNPERLILGGGIVEGLPEMIDWIHLGVEQLALPIAKANLKIVASELIESGLIGAAAAARPAEKLGESNVKSKTY